MKNLQKISFGGTAAIVTSMALIIGLNTADVTKSSIVSALLIIAFADNLSDTLSVHMYQESENLKGRVAFLTTLSNFFTRILVTFTFVAIVIFLPHTVIPIVCFCWGLLLLCALSYFLARQRRANVFTEIFKHAAVAVFVIFLAKAVGLVIQKNVF